MVAFFKHHLISSRLIISHLLAYEYHDTRWNDLVTQKPADMEGKLKGMFNRLE